jgi:hypothetical protein
MQLIVKKLPEAREKGWSDPKAQGNCGFKTQSSETCGKVFAGAGKTERRSANNVRGALASSRHSVPTIFSGEWTEGRR